MLALSLTAARQFAFIEQEEPASPSENEALIRVHAIGVCGTDVSGYLGKMPFIQFPRILGHELGIEVISVGEGVANVQPGDRCSVEPYLNCGSCPPCLAGRTNCCETLQVLGVHCDGGLRRFIKVPAHKLHPANDLAYDQLALVETLAIGCHAVNRGAPQAQETVLVLGAGPIGLSVIEFVLLTGAKLHVIEPNPARRTFLQKNYGIESTHAHTLIEPDAFFAANGGRGADVIFDATGHPGSMSRCFEYAAFGARLVYVGITSEAVTLPDPLFHRRELTLMATRNAVPTDFTRILGLIREGHIKTTPWITHRTSFSAVPDQFDGWLRPDSGVVKAMIEMD
ncbi:zinc-binding alcohol dehydrogenase family protein [Roseimicrobium sp. ORNL1]|uniref:zinc-binding alcohol dehydrogenase family protein n=1 Tax=Roseimicrobium sp. ORNL1 TaxID=2711231 RepID=UPI0013E0F29A|nr:zinc-binding alcohol dehydrogenase family protein [Roseimicrobium sp. ORNL1]QIF04878.1 zinc-binding alcohol dehydrogenase family protein [Roseimicrobium sp. ORNL1]